MTLQTFTLSLVLLCLIHFGTSVPLPLPEAKPVDAIWSPFGTNFKDPQYSSTSNMFYAKAQGWNRADDPLKYGIGVWDMKDDQRKGDEGYLRALNLEGELGIGGMARINGVEIEKNVGGGVSIGTGIGADTGAIYDSGNIEAKFFGIGGKVGKDGIQACIFVCFGIKWG